MLPEAQKHIAAVEAKDRAEREEQLARQTRDALIRQYQSAIDTAQRRKAEPCFLSDDAETVFHLLSADVDRLSNEYEKGLRQARQSARPFPFAFDSPQAICFFFGELMLKKLPDLADRVSSRDGRGLGIDEGERVRVVAECDEVIARNEALLAELMGGAQ